MRNLENFWSTFLTFETFGLKNLKKKLSDFRVNTTLWYCKKKSVFKVYALQNFFQQQCPPTVRDSCHLTNYGTQAWNQKCTAVLRSQETLSLPFTSLKRATGGKIMFHELLLWGTENAFQFEFEFSRLNYTWVNPI